MKFLKIMLIFFLTLISIELYAKCLEGDCENGEGEYKYDNDIYSGNFKNYKRDGKGTYTWESGDTYTGSWKDDKRDYGTYTWRSGDKYTGKWKDDKRHNGTYSWKAGEEYKGNWKDDYRNGSGKMEYSGGSYEGNWQKNKRHGKGLYTWKNGDTYDGEWASGIIDGDGIYTWKNGDKYDGTWASGIIDGEGLYTWRNGDTYKGGWADGVLSGRGMAIHAESKIKTGLSWGAGKLGSNDGARSDDNKKLDGTKIRFAITKKIKSDINNFKKISVLSKQVKKPLETKVIIPKKPPEEDWALIKWIKSVWRIN
ncbi:MAG: hypothetical protein GY754_26425 [bacterium]|nr:hypothetical protein [bacterium]